MGSLIIAIVIPVGICLLTLTRWSKKFGVDPWLQRLHQKKEKRSVLKGIKKLATQHEAASSLWELIHWDGAGSWPPGANHKYTVWPEPLQPYRDIYMELAPLLPQEEPSLDNQVNEARIEAFRQRYRTLLRERINLIQVMHFLQVVEAGHWGILPRDKFNAFYCSIASARHAYRWGTIPVVLVAQREKSIDLPLELVEPWELMQKHFGCPSASGNLTSNILLNFDIDGKHIYKINTGLNNDVIAAEETFARVFHEVESLSLRIYHDLILSIIAFARNDMPAVARHVEGVNEQVQYVFGVYFDKLHNDSIPHSMWLSRIQGFYAWALIERNETTHQWEQFDGLSGNQALIFQALDAWLGLGQYLSPRDMETSVPRRQREFCYALRKHSFRGVLNRESDDEYENRILKSFEKIVKKLRMFRNVHRVRAKTYLSQPAPERLPMTAGKGVLQPTLEASLEQLDVFMVRRLEETL
ncbi:hypothetical protein T440DRAFT_393374 [Plenodomus tracheiphilus IPT5]|uniref:Indoleamine 2,3-dioxygenase n=1 Tax=Plenodomus tracheiphilus IPT5 TaxID=1408161 RepID=A0A6A7BCB9_9PLEO|nr:hypothetical protein T440DRAFT_393374 [Plenodomus tracheiphilus IPT5]